MSSAQPRKPAGSTEGGQFAANQGTESATTLDAGNTKCDLEEVWSDLETVIKLSAAKKPIDGDVMERFIKALDDNYARDTILIGVISTDNTDEDNQPRRPQTDPDQAAQQVLERALTAGAPPPNQATHLSLIRVLDQVIAHQESKGQHPGQALALRGMTRWHLGHGGASRDAMQAINQNPDSQKRPHLAPIVLEMESRGIRPGWMRE